MRMRAAKLVWCWCWCCAVRETFDRVAGGGKRSQARDKARRAVCASEGSADKKWRGGRRRREQSCHRVCFCLFQVQQSGQSRARRPVFHHERRAVSAAPHRTLHPRLSCACRRVLLACRPAHDTVAGQECCRPNSNSSHCARARAVRRPCARHPTRPTACGRRNPARPASRCLVLCLCLTIHAHTTVAAATSIHHRCWHRIAPRRALRLSSLLSPPAPTSPSPFHPARTD